MPQRAPPEEIPHRPHLQAARAPLHGAWAPECPLLYTAACAGTQSIPKPEAAWASSSSIRGPDSLCPVPVYPSNRLSLDSNPFSILVSPFQDILKLHSNRVGTAIIAPVYG